MITPENNTEIHDNVDLPFPVKVLTPLFLSSKNIKAFLLLTVDCLISSKNEIDNPQFSYEAFSVVRVNYYYCICTCIVYLLGWGFFIYK